MANFFELLGFDSNDMADAMPEKIVQAFHDKGKDGVRVLMYEEMAKRLQSPLHIHIGQEDGSISNHPDVYGAEMPGEAIRLIREPTDLYRKYGESGGGSSPNRDDPEAQQPKRRGGGGGGGGGGKNTGPDAWEKRFADLADFVAKNGFRPRRTAPTDAERHLHYWMGQQQRKLGHNELPRDQAEKLEALLQATKGKKADSARKGGGGGAGGSRSRGASQADGDGDDDGGYGDDGDD
jgi:hypothetical protein